MTELVFILDRSGSMAGLEADTIGGFNAMIEKQKQEEGGCYVSTLLFDTTVDVIHDRLPLDKVPALTDKEYYVRGCTALLDAVGGAIHHIGNIHKYARKEDVPEKTLFVISTDGMENASREYTYERVRHMIERQEKKYGWEFLFLGANIDAAAEARSTPVRHRREPCGGLPQRQRRHRSELRSAERDRPGIPRLRCGACAVERAHRRRLQKP